jgi:glucans biosynthesis protein
VAIHVVEGSTAREVIDTHGLFGNGGAADAAGFRVLNRDGVSDWLAYLGASYFRASGPMGQFGLSARAIAINTALPGPEEFPAFTRFLDRGERRRPAGDPCHRRWASLCGAYMMDTTRGADAMVQDVTAALFLRRDVERLGLAPITSMFDFDEGHQGPRGDWRPEVHDSDGLAIHLANGERVWRPLDNAPRATVHMLRADRPGALA